MQKVTMLLLMLISALTSFSQQKQYIGEELLELSQSAGNEGQNVQDVITNLFMSISNAIEETQAISKEIQGSQKEGKITKGMQEKIKGRVENIHQIYHQINDQAPYYKNILEQSTFDSKDTREKSESLLQRERAELEVIETQISELEKTTSSKSQDELNRLKTLKTKRNLYNIIINTLQDFSSKMEAFEKKHNSSLLKIEGFFKQVENSSEVTELMIEVIDLTIKVEQIQENLQSLEDLEKYTREMYESIDELSRSLQSLKKIADDFV